MRHGRCIGLALGLVVSALGRLAAQDTTGAIAGVVVDSAGRPLPGARVITAGTALRETSDGNGRFAFPRVRSGAYQLRAMLIGHRPAIDSVVVQPGDTVRIRITLRLMPFHLETLPARIPRGTLADTAPHFGYTTDPVARVIGLPMLRPSPKARQRRELRLWIGFGIGIPMRLVRVTSDRGRVEGEFWRWVFENEPDSTASPEHRAFVASIPSWLRREYGCSRFEMRRLAQDQYGGAGRSFVIGCRAAFRSSPDWDSFLRKLEALDVWTLPDEDELPQLNTITTDGIGLVVEAWNGDRYRSYHFGNPDHQPSREAHQAHQILELVQDLAAQARRSQP